MELLVQLVVCVFSWLPYTLWVDILPGNVSAAIRLVLDYSLVVWFLGVGWDWAHLVRRSLFWLFCTSSGMIGEHWAVGGMRIGRGNRSIERKSAPVSSYPPQTLHGLTWNSNQGRQCGKPATNHLRYGRTRNLDHSINRYEGFLMSSSPNHLSELWLLWMRMWVRGFI
jgi:hypothetical protein